MSFETRQLIRYRAFYYVLVLSVLGLVACTRHVDPFGLPDPKNISSRDGSGAKTWNQLPHGGTDEKSNSSPCGPME